MERVQIMVGIAVLALLAATAMSETAQPLAPGTCMQVNSSFVRCTDGTAIGLAFLIKAPDAPMLGSFSVAQQDFANVTEPLDVLGSPCTVGSGATTSCFVTLSPVPLSMGNGTLVRTIRLRLRSLPYPQTVFNESINVTIQHSLDYMEAGFLNLYNSSDSGYMNENKSYAYVCGTYGICDSGVSYSIYLAGSYLRLAIGDANSNKVSAALYNASIASNVLSGGRAGYALFMNDSELILRNMRLAKEMLANASASEMQHSAELDNCTVSNTTYLEEIGLQLRNADSYPMQTSLNGSLRYLKIVTNISSYSRNAIAHCSKKAGAGGLSAAGFQFGSIVQKNRYGIILAAAVAAFAAYLVLNYRSRMEIKRIRGAKAEKKDEEERHGEQPEEEAGAGDEDKEAKLV